MNRRSYLKRIVVFGAVGVSSFSIFKWTELTRKVDPATLWSKKDMIAELAEIIIPETETPGAKSANVADYIVKVLLNCMDIKKQNKFCAGLDRVESYALDNYGKPFMNCTANEKQAVFEYIASHSGFSYRILNRINKKIFGESFYLTLRDLTIEGYCMSKPGATQGLAYDYIPGNFEACTILKPNQKSWATK
ncbi:gluconate 2-dehydrogenase subunit 3 family protein [Pedobacter gandavensis]|uniref:Gluconate 2-dehydrogenase subunit 3 family protein n=1 Tax=Pedobacter gandavensis TaxID=2679963 RepID=A0ABR6ET31_9SPHI|nr:gluconate 2-dehydrogenase subunit 3 family protein [Pedobacter gandavensis]MBB2148414.1 hypothetical protein [Pedobacter gandavensis]